MGPVQREIIILRVAQTTLGATVGAAAIRIHQAEGKRRKKAGTNGGTQHQTTTNRVSVEYASLLERGLGSHQPRALLCLFLAHAKVSVVLAGN